MREPRLFSDNSKSPDKELLSIADGLKAQTYRLRADENGFIIPSAVHAKPDASIVFLGGSTTECHFMDENARFPYLVGRNIEADLGKKINSYNTGHAGNNTMHCLLLLQGKVLPMHPQVAVLMECINDFTFLTLVGSYWTPHATRAVVEDKQYNPLKTWIINNLTRKSAPPTLQGTDEFAGVNPAQNGQNQATALKNFRKNLELFVYLCRLHDIKPVLMTQFNRFTESRPDNLVAQMKPMLGRLGISYEQYRVNYNALNDVTRAVANEQKVVLIDLDKLVPKTKDTMYDAVHLNENGSRLVAEIVAKQLLPVLR